MWSIARQVNDGFIIFSDAKVLLLGPIFESKKHLLMVSFFAMIFKLNGIF
uniref:Uncharacterized protein n=1 Tax=Manihot esculenta TaxID=3983 RepID=A0A251L6K1_MANES